MSSPLDPPEGNWWGEKINRRESIWLGLSGLWSLLIFGWMSGYTRFGEQNPIGETFETSPEQYQEKVVNYMDEAGEAADGSLIPPGDDIYVAALQWSWMGAPVTVEAGTEYNLHLSSLDVQHGFSIRPEQALSKQMNFQILPDYEWVLPMTFDEPGTYHLVCNEFCGVGHRTMHGRVEVVEDL
ncbi:cytochrome c oxidase subunit II [Halobacteriales archaeon Cl-PHB]